VRCRDTLRANRKEGRVAMKGEAAVARVLVRAESGGERPVD
jgi:hypothetical protein